MADLHQSGSVATLHRLDTATTVSLDDDLESFARRRPIALVLPCFFAQCSRPAIRHVIEVLRGVGFLDLVVVSLGQASADDLEVAKAAFGVLPQRVALVWNDGPAIQSLYTLLGAHGLACHPDRRSRACWIASGYVLADGRCDVIAVHDCDLRGYSREALARLCYPAASPDLGFEFVKGGPARMAAGASGALERLLVTPLVASLQQVVGHVPFLSYLDSFRRPFSGEFAIRSDIARQARLLSGRGLELGLLVEAWRTCGPKRICQAELPAGAEDDPPPASEPPAGDLVEAAAADVAVVLLRAVAAESVVFTKDLLGTLVLRYVRSAEDAIDRLEADAVVNGLVFDRHGEETMVGTLACGLTRACERFRDAGAAPAGLPSWNRVVSAIPGFFGLLRAAVRKDGLDTAVA